MHKLSKSIMNDKWLYALLLFPVISAILALTHSMFIFKSGTAGFGAIFLLILYFKTSRHSNDILFLITAFMFSIIGDWILSNKHASQNMFIIGIILFFVAHVGYLLFAKSNGKIDWTSTITILIVYLLFFLKLYPSLNSVALAVSVFVYLVISSFSLGTALGMHTEPVVKWSYALGIILILFSDTIIALNEFCGYVELNELILPTYYLAHILITFSLIRRHLINLSDVATSS